MERQLQAVGTQALGWVGWGPLVRALLSVELDRESPHQRYGSGLGSSRLCQPPRCCCNVGCGQPPPSEEPLAGDAVPACALHPFPRGSFVSASVTRGFPVYDGDSLFLLCLWQMCFPFLF